MAYLGEFQSAVSARPQASIAYPHDGRQLVFLTPAGGLAARKTHTLKRLTDNLTGKLVESIETQAYSYAATFNYSAILNHWRLFSTSARSKTVLPFVVRLMQSALSTSVRLITQINPRRISLTRQASSFRLTSTRYPSLNT